MMVKLYKSHLSISHKLFAQNSSTSLPDHVPCVQKLRKYFLVSEKKISIRPIRFSWP